ncbi:MAG: hypothetical protein AAFO73_12610, partial [Pseudomonadota bacterium]
MGLSGRPIIPFRWDLSRREQLGRLVDDGMLPVPRGFHGALRETCAKIVAFSNDSDLVFVGRSPEHMFDYLSGAFEGVSIAPNVSLLQFSKALPSWRWRSGQDGTVFEDAEKRALLDYMQALNIDPLSLMAAPRSLRFVDFVSEGGTFLRLLELYRGFASDQGADWNVVSRR